MSEKQYQHAGGRTCTWDQLQRQWRYGENLQWACDRHDDDAVRSTGMVDMSSVDDKATNWGGPYMPQFELKITHDGIYVDYGGEGYTVPAVTPEARVILTKILPELLNRFLTKNHKYSEVDHGFDLGARGIFPDCNRKLGILYSRVWLGDGDNPGEDTDEVIDDLIGHLLLLKSKLRDGRV